MCSLGNSTELTFEEQNDSFGSSNDDSADEATDGVTNSSDGEEAEHKDEGEDEEGDDHNANAGWAEVMAKILGKKTPESQTSILLKNKELDKVKEEEQQEKLQRKKQVISEVKHTVKLLSSSLISALSFCPMYFKYVFCIQLLLSARKSDV